MPPAGALVAVEAGSVAVAGVVAVRVGVATARVGVAERIAVAEAGTDVAVATGRVGVAERAGVDERMGVDERAGVADRTGVDEDETLVDVRVGEAPGALSQYTVLPEPRICPRHVIVSRSPALSTIVIGVAVTCAAGAACSSAYVMPA